MPHSHRTRRINPRLGTYFGIFVAGFLALGILALIAEQLGAPDWTLRLGMLLGPLGLYAGIATAAASRDVGEYFAAGRRVPAFFSGLNIGVGAVGGVGVVSLTGAMMINGIDAWAIVNGLVAGMVVSAVLVAPYLRKFGSFTLPSYLGRRFDSRLLRMVLAAVMAVPLLLLAIAELKIAVMVTERLGHLIPFAAALIVAATLAVMLGAGGIRSTSWASAAAALACVIAIVVPVGIVATDVTNFPLAQLSYGPTLRAIGRFEDIRGMPSPLLSPLSFDLAGTALEPLTRRMSHPFGSLGPASYILTSMVVMMGIAVIPWLAPRIGATPGIYDARKSMGWAVLVIGVITLTGSAYAVFERNIVMQHLVGHDAATLPEWFKALVAVGEAGVDGRATQPPLAAFAFKRDSLLFMLPLADHLPRTLDYGLMAGALAAALCAAGCSLQALATILAEDVVHGSQWEAPATRGRLLVARGVLVVVIVAVTLVALTMPGDPLQLALWALGLSAAGAFPAVLLSIWWKRLNAFGAAVAVVTGFTVAVLAIVAGETNWFGVPSEVVGVFGVAAGFVAAFFATRLRPAPGRHVLEMVRDMRIPGGETVHDREQRLLRLKRRQRPA